MANSKISALTVPSSITSDAYMPLVQTNGMDEVNYKGDAPLIAPWLAPDLSNELTVPAYIKSWNANTNTPTLTSSLGANATLYIVNVAGTTTLDGISNWQLGDFAYFNGVWNKLNQVITRPVTTISADTNTDSISTEIIGVTATPVTVTLGNQSRTDRRIFTIKDQGGLAGVSPITIDPESGVIEGQPTIQITVEWGFVNVYTNGTDWFVR